MTDQTRTDLAAELDTAHIDSIRKQEERIGNTVISTVEILTDEASAALAKPKGKYITADIGKIWLATDEDFESAAKAVSDKLSMLSRELCGGEPKSILIAGLGNRHITADALGDESVGLITVTRHLKAHNSRLFTMLGGRELSAVAPGVLGQTGIETAEFIKGVCLQTKPELVIAIDSLCARSTSRLATTVQLGSSGISPGSGIGNHRKALDRDTLGIPVIAYGIPTVVDSATLVLDALSRAGIDEPDDRILKVLSDRHGFFVTPKETDTIVRELSRLTARAITMSFGGL